MRADAVDRCAHEVAAADETPSMKPARPHRNMSLSSWLCLDGLTPVLSPRIGMSAERQNLSMSRVARLASPPYVHTHVGLLPAAVRKAGRCPLTFTMRHFVSSNAERVSILSAIERHIKVEKTKAMSEPKGGRTFAAVLEAFKHQVELDRFLLCRANFKARVTRSMFGHVRMSAEQVVQIDSSERYCADELNPDTHVRRCARRNGPSKRGLLPYQSLSSTKRLKDGICAICPKYTLDVGYWRLCVPIAFYAPGDLSEAQLVSHSEPFDFPRKFKVGQRAEETPWSPAE
ncbi:hypothetical protein C6P46_000589 [Rhodotorula mucilaginosa]|uniref:Uncharacterized protein n=1 Tax=Rhodotorula mucilaginosa TaxID=5537 RepID=A0A9P6W8B3_RHOMI|nr:hypothetical protein C6P46_000589 [Rhodotorula mucilaginosa]